MVNNRNAHAYDLSLFEPKKAQVTNIRPNKKQIKANRRRARLQALLNAVAAATVAVVIVGAFGMMIVGRVQLTEMNNTITMLEKEEAILVSEQKSLTHTLAAQTSAQSVEEYARANGMQKVESYQITYFTVEDAQPAQTTETAPTWWESAWSSITHFFGATA